jgi:hypothetical protein
LPGSDVFIATQLAYKNEINRDGLVVRLNNEAYKIFLSSELIRNYSQISIEQEKVKRELETGTFNLETYVLSESSIRLMQYQNLEKFYIAAGFELHFKALLLQKDFVVNIFEDVGKFKDLYKLQGKTPIHKNEIFKISGYFYDDVKGLNILPGITSSSLKFSTICKEKASPVM